MDTESRTDHDADDFVERLTTLLDERGAGLGMQAQPGEPGRDEAGALVEELRSVSAWAGPPAGLRETILARIQAGPSVVPVQATASITPAPTPAASDTPVAAAARNGLRDRWLAGWRLRWRRLAWAVPATAFVAALFTLGILTVERALQPGEPQAKVFAITGSQLAPQATGEIRVSDMPSGFSFVVDVKQLPAAAPGSYYAAWLQGPEGFVPLGSFHMRQIGTPVKLWSGVAPDRYPNLIVTLQAEGDPPGPSQLVVFTAKLDR